mmetsp:Transcript_7759/g.15980  ORF Transcript_7759/g.15980 Transcript_7759/m.15980 type:complete len:234 (-) Transcript_7759:973-1674(-)
MQASTAPPMNLPSMKNWGKVLHPVSSCRADRYLFPMLSLANSKESMSMRWYSTPRASRRPVSVQQNSQYSSMKQRTLRPPISFLTHSVASGSTSGRPGAGGGIDGVEAASSFSSSVMSAGIPSKRGVERYRSPVSGIRARNVEPSGASFASFRVAAKTPPPLVPEQMPSLRASSLQVSIASMPLQWRTLSYTPACVASSTSLGMKSAAHPWNKWGRQTGWATSNEEDGLPSSG